MSEDIDGEIAEAPRFRLTIRNEPGLRPRDYIRAFAVEERDALQAHIDAFGERSYERRWHKLEVMKMILKLLDHLDDEEAKKHRGKSR